MRYITILLALLFITHQSNAQEAAQAYSLEDCINYAVEHSQDIEVARLEEYIAKAIVGETLSEGLPQLNANVDLANNFKVPTSFVPGEFFGQDAGTFVPVQFSPQYNGQAGLQLSQLIFDGSYFVGLQASKVFQDLSKKEHVRTRIDVIEAVTKAYYNVLVTQEGLELISQNYGRLDTLLNNTKGMYESGFAEKIDVNRIQVQFNNIKVQLKNSRELFALSYSTLKFQMGMPVEESLVLAESIADLEFENLDTNTDGFDYTDRIEYSVLQTNRELAKLDLKNNKVQYYPRLEAYGALGANSAGSATGDLFDFDQNWYGNGIFGFRMEIPVFDGFYKHYRIQQNKLKLRQIDENFEKLENSIALEVGASKVSYQNAIENLEAQKENMKLAEEVFNVAKIKYEAGVGSNLEVVDADTAYKEAQTNYYNALFDALIAKVDFEKATGQLYNNEFAQN